MIYGVVLLSWVIGAPLFLAIGQPLSGLVIAAAITLGLHAGAVVVLDSRPRLGGLLVQFWLVVLLMFVGLAMRQVGA